MCSKRCKASHEQGRYCRATDFQDPSNPSTIVRSGGIWYLCIRIGILSCVCKNCCFSMLHLLESLKLPLFTLLCTQGSASEKSFWHGRKKQDFCQYQLAVHFNLEMGFSWTKQKPAAYFLNKSMYRVFKLTLALLTKIHLGELIFLVRDVVWRDSFVCPPFLAFSALLLEGTYLYFSHFERCALDALFL